MSEQVGPVRVEAERLAAAVLARLAAASGVTGAARDAAADDAERPRRLTRAAGDVAVAVTGLVRELTGGPGPAVAPGLREGFLGLAGGLLAAAGVDPRADPPPPRRAPWQTGAADPTGDAWRAATRADWRAATGDSERKF